MKLLNYFIIIIMVSIFSCCCNNQNKYNNDFVLEYDNANLDEIKVEYSEDSSYNSVNISGSCIQNYNVCGMIAKKYNDTLKVLVYVTQECKYEQYNIFFLKRVVFLSKINVITFGRKEKFVWKSK